MARSDEAFLELDAPTETPLEPVEHPAVAHPFPDDAWLELPDPTPGSPADRGQRSAPALTDDDLRVVSSLAEDARPLLASLWPSEPDLAARLPDARALSDRLSHARMAINQATRRGAEWRARAELAGTALARRLTALGATDPAELARSAGEALRAYHLAALTAQARADADGGHTLYAAEVRRLDAEALARGIDPAEVRALCASIGIERVTGDAGWTACEALPGAPRTRDAVAEALVTAHAQGLVALRDGALATWLAANRAPADLLESEAEARRLTDTPETAALGRWTLAWALGREGVRVEGLEAGAPEALLAHMRSARLHDSQVESHATVLAGWYRRRGHHTVAAALDALSRGEAHAAARLRWALGEPLRVGGRAVQDPRELAREVVTREAVRTAALTAWRDGSLAAWLAALPMARRDAAWADELSADHAMDPTHEGTFWRGVYRRVPRAALRVPVQGGVVRLATVQDLTVTARAAAAWGPLQGLLRSGELTAWLEAAAPGMDLTDLSRGTDGDGDLALNAVLWAVGHTGLVLPWGHGGIAITAPMDVVHAWSRNPAVLAPAGVRTCVTAWLARFHGDARVGGVSVGRLLSRVLPRTGVPVPAGHEGLLLALLCGLDVLPLDPTRGGPLRTARAWVGVDRHPAEGTDRAAAWAPLREYVATGLALLWAARHAPELGAVLATEMDTLDTPGGAAHGNDLLAVLVTVGVPRPSAVLAGELDVTRETAAREALRVAAARESVAREAARQLVRIEAEREAVRVQSAQALARIEAEREAARVQSARDALRGEAEREIAELTARREEARLAMEYELARLAAVREAARLAEAREAALAAAREESAREAERLALALEAAEAEGRRVLALQEATALEAARRTAAREEASQRAAAHAVDARRAQELRWAEERAEAEGAVARLTHAAAEAEAQAQRAAEEARRAERAAAVAVQTVPTATEATEDTADALEAVTPEAVFGAEALRAPEQEDPSGEVWAWGDRREIVGEKLVAAAVDDATRTRVLAAVDAWARALPNHPWQDLAARMTVKSVDFHPTFEIAVTTRLESRETGVARPPWDDTHTVAAPPDVVAREDRGLPVVDPWAVSLPEADTYGPWTATYGLDLAPVREACGVCDGLGRSPCTRCEGTGTVPCRVCDATGRARCPRCVGAGSVLGEHGTERCTACDGRRDVRCEGCTAGRAVCRGCVRSGRVPCAGCNGRGAVVQRVSVAQRFASVAALGVVAPGVPPAVAAAVRAAVAEGRPVVHVEGAVLDPFALAREIPHPEVAAHGAQLLADEAARGGDGARATRQRLLVRRVPVWAVTYRAEDRDDVLWVHGVQMKVTAEDSPVGRWMQGLVTAAREALAAGDLATATERLLSLVQVDAEHVEGRGLAGLLGQAVRDMALRGELFAAREAAAQAARLRWPECVVPLVEAERVLARRLNAPTAWALVEEAARALDRGRLDRAAERLTALALTAPVHAEGQRLAEILAGKLRAVEGADRATLAALAVTVGRVPWGGCPEAALAVTREITRAQRSEQLRVWGPWVTGAVVAMGLLAVLWGR